MVASKTGRRRRKKRKRQDRRRHAFSKHWEERIFQRWLKEMVYWGFGGAISIDYQGNTIRIMVGRRDLRGAYTIRPLSPEKGWRLYDSSGNSRAAWVFRWLDDAKTPLFHLLSQRLEWKLW